MLEVDGEKRSVWLNTQVVAAKVAERVGAREALDFDFGERITITRLGQVESKTPGHKPYWNWQVLCENDPPVDAKRALGGVLEDVATGRLKSEEPGQLDGNGDAIPPADGDDIPF